MSNQYAVRQIIKNYIDLRNRKNKVWLKFALYGIAIAAGLYLFLGLHKFQAGVLVTLGFSAITAAAVGFPSALMEMSSIRFDPVPDEIYAALKNSTDIEPGLLEMIRAHMSPEFTVDNLVACEEKYHNDMKIVSAPGYRSMQQDK